MVLQLGGKEPIERLIRKIEKAEVPLGEEESKLEKIKEKHTRREPLTPEETNLVLELAKKAEEWGKPSNPLREPSQNRRFQAAKS